MNTKNKIILLCMILIVIAIITIGIILVILYTSSINETDVNTNTEFEKQDMYISNDKLEELKNKNKYFAIQKIINSYFSYIEEMNGDKPYYFEKEYKNEVLEKQKQEGLKALRSMSQEYYNSKSDDIIIQDGSEYSKYNVEIKNMYILEKSSRINIFFIELLVGKKESQLIIKTDSFNMTFTIFPNSFVSTYNNKEESVNRITDKEIQKNDYNTYNYTNITDEYVAKLYFNNYKQQLLNNIEKAYSLLETNYASKRFGNLESFKDYAQNIIDEKIEIKEYLVNLNDEYIEYVCKDQYGNLYIFKETAVMKYTLTLDTYTVEQEKFNVEYEKATNQQKVIMNIDKFFQMINAKDYKSAYSVLNDDFKNNHLKKEEDFKKCIKERVFSYNDVEYVSYYDDIASIYKYDLIIKNRLDNSKQINFTIAMKLKEGTDFEMSFSID